MCKGELRFRMPKFSESKAYLLHNLLSFFDIDTDEETDDDYDLASDFSEDPIIEENERVVLMRSLVSRALERERLREQRWGTGQTRTQYIAEHQIIRRQQRSIAEMGVRERRNAEEIIRQEHHDLWHTNQVDDPDLEDGILVIDSDYDSEQREDDEQRTLGGQSDESSDASESRDGLDRPNTNDQDINEDEAGAGMADSSSDDIGLRVLSSSEYEETINIEQIQAVQQINVSETGQRDAEEQSDENAGKQEDLEIQNTNERNVVMRVPEEQILDSVENEMLDDYLVTITRNEIEDEQSTTDGENPPGTSIPERIGSDITENVSSEGHTGDSIEDDLIGEILRDENLKTIEPLQWPAEDPDSVGFELLEDLQDENKKQRKNLTSDHKNVDNPLNTSERDDDKSGDVKLIRDSNSEYNDSIRVILRDEDLEMVHLEQCQTEESTHHEYFDLRSPSEIDYELVDDIENEESGCQQESENYYDNDEIEEQAYFNVDRQEQIDVQNYSLLEMDLAISSSVATRSTLEVVMKGSKRIQRKRRTFVCKRCRKPSTHRHKRSSLKSNRSSTKDNRANKQIRNKSKMKEIKGMKCRPSSIHKRRFNLKSWRSRVRTTAFLRDRVLNAVRTHVSHLHAEVQKAFEDYAHFQKTDLPPLPNK